MPQIDFVFTDKTGTLTRNQMQFRKARTLNRATRGAQQRGLT